MASFLWLYDTYSGSLGYTCYTSSYRVSATAASMGEVLSHSVQDWAQTFAAFQQMLQADRPVVMKACRCAVPSLHSMQLQNLRCAHRMRLTPLCLSLPQMQSLYRQRLPLKDLTDRKVETYLKFLFFLFFSVTGAIAGPDIASARVTKAVVGWVHALEDSLSVSATRQQLSHMMNIRQVVSFVQSASTAKPKAGQPDIRFLYQEISPLPDGAGLQLVSVHHGYLGARIGFSRLRLTFVRFITHPVDR